MRGGGGRHRFTLIGRKLVGKPAKMNYMNIHERGKMESYSSQVRAENLACLGRIVDNVV